MNNKIPDWERFDPAQIDTTKKHALFLCKLNPADINFVDSYDTPFDDAFLSLNDFAREHPPAKVILVDRKRHCIIMANINGLEKTIIDNISSPLGVFLNGEELQKKMIKINKGLRDSLHEDVGEALKEVGFYL